MCDCFLNVLHITSGSGIGLPGIALGGLDLRIIMWGRRVDNYIKLSPFSSLFPHSLYIYIYIGPLGMEVQVCHDV